MPSARPLAVPLLSPPVVGASVQTLLTLLHLALPLAVCPSAPGLPGSCLSKPAESGTNEPEAALLAQVKMVWGSGLFYFLPIVAPRHTPPAPAPTRVCRDTHTLPCVHMLSASWQGPADPWCNVGSRNLTPNSLWQTSKPPRTQTGVCSGQEGWWGSLSWSHGLWWEPALRSQARPGTQRCPQAHYTPLGPSSASPWQSERRVVWPVPYQSPRSKRKC